MTYLAEHKISLNTVDQLTDLKDIFPDSDIVQKMCPKRSKVIYIIKDVSDISKEQVMT